MLKSNRNTVRKGIVFKTKTQCSCIRATPIYDKEFKQVRCLNCGHRTGKHHGS